MKKQILINEAIMAERQKFARGLERFETALREMAGDYEGETAEVLYYLARWVGEEARTLETFSDAVGW